MKADEVLQFVSIGDEMARRSHRINVMFYDEDFARLVYWSKKKGLSLSSFVRLLAMESIEKYKTSSDKK